MREIKFRAYDKQNRKMHSHEEISDLTFYLKTIDGKGDFACPLYQFLLKYQGGENQQNNCILQQFTGLKDKNGKEIYEGDIIQEIENGHEENKPTLYFIEHDAQYALFRFKYLKNTRLGFSGHHYDSYKSEIIGNIYENPDLLKQYARNQIPTTN